MTCGAVALVFDSGLELDYYPDDRSKEQWTADQNAAIADYFPGRYVVVRWTDGVGAEPDPSGPSSLVWQEGQDELTLYGRGWPVDDLIAFANSLVADGG
ncbi:MAG: hypothetical protein ABR600_01555 [Actinomycetota bacterium]